MSKCCGDNKADRANIKNTDPSDAAVPVCCSASSKNPKDTLIPGSIAWFHDMIPHCIDYAQFKKKKGVKIVGIMCEYTPREIIMAAGGIPVCLCGGSEEMIPAAEEYLPANLCPLVKSTFGYSINKANPLLEMADLLVAETTCDGKKKMYELLEQRHPMHVLELPQKAGDPGAFEHWVLELQKLKQDLEQRFSVQITDKSLRSAIDLMNEERSLRRRLAALMKLDEPPLTGTELLDMKSLISCIPSDFKQYENALNELPGRTIDPPAESRVRVLLTGVPLPHGAERVMSIIEGNGGLVVCQENCTGIKPIDEDIDPTAGDLIRAIASKYFHLPCSVMTKNTARIDLVKKLFRQYRPQCVIEIIWQACLTYDVETVHIKRFVEEELGVPYLRIETDYSPSDTARIAVRVQALFELVR
ncbi:MAG: 2-hydroxyacyl-CoA dehydratase [Proteobacteria bacterium]|nr:2-hydroxyacyl-CoA dehydratase [Pseudomonadota bacterium]